MVLRLSYGEPDFEARFAAFLTTKREVSEDVETDVRAIIRDVRGRGDEALHDFSLRFDGLDTRKVGLAVTAEEVEAAHAAVDPDVIAALQLAHDRIASHHARQMPRDDHYTDALGVELGSRWTAIE
ncbi:MAG: histidinol dehydrogenase, partial [Hoeflea sp.]